LTNKLINYAISIALLFYFLIISFIYITDSAHQLVLINQLFGTGAFIYCLAQKKMRKEWLFPTLILLSCVIGSSFLILRNPFGFGNIANVFAASGISILILRVRVNVNIIMIWFIIVALYYIGLIINGVHPDLAHASPISRNAISVHMLFITVTIYLICYINNKQLPLLLSLTLLIICLWAIGRGGIVTSILLLVSLLYTKFKRAFKNIALWPVLAISLITISIFGFSISSDIKEIIELERTLNDALSRSELTSERDNIIKDFFKQSSFLDLLIGQDLYKGVMWYEWGGNTHNSFLSLAAYTGFLGFLIFFYWIYVNFYFFKTEFIIGALMMVVFIRLMTEYIVWFSVFDYIPFLFLFLYKDMVNKRKLKLE
jgi:hypothetical protein